MDSNITKETKRIWETNASFWDEYMGEGNHFQRLLIGPVTEKLLEIEPDHQVLDIACGNGNFSRRMADLGARVVAFDFSPTFIQRARQHNESYKDRISFEVIDATDSVQLASLGQNRFNSAVCSMALMDIPDIKPLINSLPKLLKPDGRFVFSISHPCLNSIGSSKFVEEQDQEGELITSYGIKINQYIHHTISKGLGVIGQPVPQIYFHRPISDYFNCCFQAGFVLDGIEEPVFPGDLRHDRPFSWANFKDIPPVFIARMQL